MSFAARSSSVVARSAARGARMAPAQVRGVQRRFSSENPGDAGETTNMWWKISLASTAAVVVPTTFIMAYIESTHPHHAKHMYPHMGIRAKPFPWGKCDVFDVACHSGETH